MPLQLYLAPTVKDAIRLLVHAGTICMELARQQRDSHFLSLAIRSLKKARETSPRTLPVVSLLLAQAEGSLGNKAKWEKNLHDEWLSWSPGIYLSCI